MNKRGSDAVMTLTQACRAFGLTARALHHYDETGLLRARRSPRNRRVYDRRAQDDLELICGLRLAGASLKEIRHVLALREPAGRNAQLDRAADILRRQIVQLETQARGADAALRSIVAKRQAQKLSSANAIFASVDNQAT